MAATPPLSIPACVVSVLLRASAYIFLRLLPIRGLTVGIPILFAAHLLLFIVGEITKKDDASGPTATVTVIEEETIVAVTVDDVKSEEIDAKVGEVNGTVAAAPKEGETIIAVEDTTTVITQIDPLLEIHDGIFALVLSLPSPWFFIRLASVIINAFLLLFSLDYIYRPFVQTFPDLAYARVGAVTPHMAKLVLRYPLPPLMSVMTAADEANRAGEMEQVEQLLAEDSRVVKVWWRETLELEGIDEEELSWSEGPVVELLEENDWVGVVQLEKLLPATEYEYRFAFANSSVLPVSSGSLTFRTFPKATGAHFKFIASSCLTPNFPYVPSLSSNPRIKGFDLLAATIAREHKRSILGSTPEAASPEAAKPPSTPVEEAESTPAPTEESTATVEDGEVPAQAPLMNTVGSMFSAATEKLQAAVTKATGGPVPTLPKMQNPLSLFANLFPKPPQSEEPQSDANTEFAILLGDFIYADVPKYGGDDLEMYRRLYRRVYASESYKKIYEHLPTFHIYDDHEIGPNYIGNSNDSAAPFPRANGAYEVYQNSANYDPIRPGGNYYEFEYADSAFFVMDCRRYRTVSEHEIGDKATMLGEQQLEDFYQWLSRVNNTHTFKFVVSSVPFNTLWYGIDGQIDTWAGYKTERHEVLQKMASVANVIILTGDRHEFAAVATFGRERGSVMEFSTSPLNQFYLPLYTSFDTKATTTAKWTRQVERIVKSDVGEDEVQIVEETVPEEQVLKYVREGQHKWGSFEVDTRDEQKPKLTFELFVDGSRAWRFNVVAKAVKKIPPTTSLTVGRAIGANFKHAMEALGVWKALGL